MHRITSSSPKKSVRWRFGYVDLIPGWKSNCLTMKNESNAKSDESSETEQDESPQ